MKRETLIHFAPCYNKREAMLTYFYPKLNDVITDFCTLGPDYYMCYLKYSRWLKTYTTNIMQANISTPISQVLMYLSIKERFDTQQGFITKEERHVKSSKKHICLFKSLNKYIDKPTAKHFPHKEIASFFLPIFEMLEFVISDENELTDVPQNIDVYIDYLICKLADLEVNPITESDKALLELCFNFVFRNDVASLDAYILDHPLEYCAN